ncbi:MAG: L-histidine N(alpha)-methyltransferase [Oleiphilaceae bacterium]|nr:L-histidine N(alpha)-methyltransferase [Oleiphilaceae bacterium]
MLLSTVTQAEVTPQQRLHVHDLPTPVTDQASEIIQGLLATQKTVSPKYFYDDEGSRLFDQITRLKEYYPTRAEHGILSRYADQICAHMDGDTAIIEPGSGTSDKVRHLLDPGFAATYAPIEISKECLLSAASALTEDYPALTVHAICADFTALAQIPHALSTHRKTAFFPGSTIGNFEPDDAIALLKSIHSMIGINSRLLIGVDLLKSVDILHAAYNDNAGVTAQFNLNLLKHIGRVMDCEFDMEKFSHLAVFNPEHGRIEMHLKCEQSHQMMLQDNEIRFEKNETIHTENSYKYTIEQFESLAEQAGFQREATWLDDDALFSFHAFIAV